MQPNGSAAHSVDTPNISDAESDAEILRLAGLPVLAYGRERKAAGEKLGLSLAWLDKVVNRKKAELTAEIAGNGEGEGVKGARSTCPTRSRGRIRWTAARCCRPSPKRSRNSW